MAVTRGFKETVQARASQDVEFRENLLKESIECMLTTDIAAGKLLLRDYINATIGFEALAAIIDKSPKSLMRMLSATGNPTASNLFSIIHILQQREGLHFHVHVDR